MDIFLAGLTFPIFNHCIKNETVDGSITEYCCQLFSFILLDAAKLKHNRSAKENSFENGNNEETVACFEALASGLTDTGGRTGAE